MKPRRIMVATLCGMALLGGCSFDVANNNHWLIKPTMSAAPLFENPQVWYDLGRYYQGQERHQEAIWAFEKVLAANGSAIEARSRLGASLAALGRYEEAITQFRMVVSAAPESAHMHSNLGYAYMLAGQADQAVSSLERAVSLDPSNQRALNNLGMAYAQIGNVERAREAFSGAAGSDQPARASHPEKGGPQEAAPALAQEESRAQVVQLAPNVYELRTREAAPVMPVVVAVSRSGYSKVRLEVSNGNGVTGMARRVGSYLKDGGFATSRLTNQGTFAVPLSRVEYREGLEAEAKRVAAAMPREVAIVQNSSLRRDIGMRLVLGRDLASKLAYFEPRGEAVNLAQN